MIQGKPQTVVVRMSRDDLIRSQRSPSEFIIGSYVMKTLRDKGVPIIGILAPFAVEYGALTITKEDGLDGDEFVYKWTGVPLPYELRKHHLTFQVTLEEVLRRSKPVEQEDEM